MTKRKNMSNKKQKDLDSNILGLNKDVVVVSTLEVSYPIE